MKRKRTYLVVFLTIFLMAFANNDLLAQCSMCKQAAETSLKSNPGSLARGLNSGILYLMAVPYLMIMFIFRKQIVAIWRSKFGKASKTEI